MLFDGIRFQRVNHLKWRYAKQGDFYVNGKPIGSNYIVVFSKKTGKVMPIRGHSLTNLALGELRGVKYTMYFVFKGKIYTASGEIKNKDEVELDLVTDRALDREARHIVEEALEDLEETIQEQAVSLVGDLHDHEVPQWETMVRIMEDHLRERVMKELPGHAKAHLIYKKEGIW